MGGCNNFIYKILTVMSDSLLDSRRTLKSGYNQSNKDIRDKENINEIGDYFKPFQKKNQLLNYKYSKYTYQIKSNKHKKSSRQTALAYYQGIRNKTKKNTHTERFPNDSLVTDQFKRDDRFYKSKKYYTNQKCKTERENVLYNSLIPNQSVYKKGTFTIRDHNQTNAFNQTNYLREKFEIDRHQKELEDKLASHFRIIQNLQHQLSEQKLLTQRQYENHCQEMNYEISKRRQIQSVLKNQMQHNIKIMKENQELKQSAQANYQSIELFQVLKLQIDQTLSKFVECLRENATLKNKIKESQEGCINIQGTINKNSVIKQKLQSLFNDSQVKVDNELRKCIEQNLVLKRQIQQLKNDIKTQGKICIDIDTQTQNIQNNQIFLQIQQYKQDNIKLVEQLNYKGSQVNLLKKDIQLLQNQLKIQENVKVCQQSSTSSIECNKVDINEDIKMEVQGLRQMIFKYQAKKAKDKQCFNLLKQENACFKKQIQQLKIKQAQYKLQWQAKTKQIARKEMQISRYLNQVQELQTQLANFNHQSHTQKQNQGQSKLKVLELANSKIQKQKEVLERQAQTFKKQVIVVKKQLQKIKKISQKYRSNFYQLEQAQKKDLEIEDYLQEITELKVKAELQTSNKFKEVIKVLELEIQTLRAKLDQSQTERQKHLIDQIEHLQQGYFKLQKQNKSLVIKIHCLQKKSVQQRDQIQRKNQKQLMNIRKRLKSYRKQNQVLRSQMQRLQWQIKGGQCRQQQQIDFNISMIERQQIQIQLSVIENN